MPLTSSPKRDAVADYLSQEWSFEQIADSMGITGGTACSLWCRICARLGEAVQ
jgi:hypothetical protein